MKNISLALNQIILPEAPFSDFINFAKKLDVDAIEIRNDTKTNLINENDPLQVKEECEKNSIKILSINALQKFNIWNSDRKEELIILCEYAQKANINSIVLVPLNDGSIKSEKDKKKLLEVSLNSINNILQDYNVKGLVEPLGFKKSSLQFKSLAVEIINNLQKNKLQLVHDTFHHKLSNENNFFSPLTGLVHFSGVSNKYDNIDLQDDHRSIVDEFDIIDNISQINKLIKENYNGYFSFEPFSNELISNINIFEITKNCLSFIKKQI